MADNCSSLEPWVFRTAAFADTYWMSDAFARETETLTKALQISLSQDSPDSSLPPTPTPTPAAVSTPSFSVKYEPAVSASDSESGPRRVRNTALPGASGKISKRKSRASKRSPTTFINADPANFRQMVQQVTGVRLGDSPLPVEAVLMKPEPQRPVGRVVIPQSCLPTLDTSAFLLDREILPAQSPVTTPTPTQHNSHYLPAVESSGGLFDFESFPCFPTLESWGVM